MKMSQERTPKGRATDAAEVGRQDKDGFKKETINREVSVIRKPVR